MLLWPSKGPRSSCRKLLKICDWLINKSHCLRYTMYTVVQFVHDNFHDNYWAWSVADHIVITFISVFLMWINLVKSVMKKLTWMWCQFDQQRTRLIKCAFLNPTQTTFFFICSIQSIFGYRRIWKANWSHWPDRFQSDMFISIWGIGINTNMGSGWTDQ